MEGWAESDKCNTIGTLALTVLIGKCLMGPSSRIWEHCYELSWQIHTTCLLYEQSPKLVRGSSRWGPHEANVGPIPMSTR